MEGMTPKMKLLKKEQEEKWQALLEEAAPQMQQDIKMVNILAGEVAKMHADTQEVHLNSMMRFLACHLQV